MSYVRNHLQEGETVVYQTTVHWMVYGRAVLWALAAVIVGLLYLRHAASDYAIGLQAAAAFLAFGAVVEWLRAVIRRTSTELAITDRRIIVKTGLIRRRTSEMNRSKVESVLVDQGIIGRMLDYGTIVIKGTGGGLEPLTGIDGPIKFRSHVTAG